jgi:hypothetical protein
LTELFQFKRITLRLKEEGNQMASLDELDRRRQSAAIRTPSWDDTQRRRRRFMAVAQGGKSLGYFALAIATAAALIAYVSGFRFYSGLVMATALIAAIAVLPLSMIVVFGCRAAEREDRQYYSMYNPEAAAISEAESIGEKD